jgi:hypothetical protein
MYLQHCTITPVPGNPSMAKVTGKCVITEKEHSVIVPFDGVEAYKAGAYIQAAFPRTSADDREFLISGCSPEGWEKVFGKKDFSIEEH